MKKVIFHSYGTVYQRVNCQRVIHVIHPPGIHHPPGAVLVASRKSCDACAQRDAKAQALQRLLKSTTSGCACTVESGDIPMSCPKKWTLRSVILSHLENDLYINGGLFCKIQWVFTCILDTKMVLLVSYLTLNSHDIKAHYCNIQFKPLLRTSPLRSGPETPAGQLATARCEPKHWRPRCRPGWGAFQMFQWHCHCRDYKVR